MASVSTTSTRAFGIALKRARRAARQTQAHLAEAAGFSVVYISMLERGARVPQRTTVALLADALALAPSERATLEAAASLSPVRSGRDTKAHPLPIGAFLGAVPAGPLVGREAELTGITAALEAVMGGQGRLLVLVGEPGVGKTRLAQEISLLARAQGVRILTGRCYEPQQTLAYSPFLEVLAQAVATAEAGGPSPLAERWPEVARLLPDQPASTPAPISLDDGNAQQRLFWQVSGFLGALAEQTPLALLLDDLHWADRASLDLLQHQARQTRERPILLVGTARAVEAQRQHPLAAALSDLSRDEMLQRVPIQRLAVEETSALIGATLGVSEGAEIGGTSVSAQLSQLIYQRSEGNAFFTRQLTRALQEQDELQFAEGQWRLRAGTLTTLSTPESIRSVIGQRLGRLTSLTQEVLREASVLGQVLAFDDLQRMGGRGEQEVEEALEEAAGAGIMREGQRDHYHFNHALTRDTLYADLSARRKRRLHRAAADAIERLPDHARRVGELSYHLLAAEEGERALPYTLLAGDQAEAVYAHAEAEGHFRLARELARELGDPAREAEALEKLGTTIHLMGQSHETSVLLERALGAYQTMEDQEGELRALSAWLRAQAEFGRDLMDEAATRAQVVLARIEPQEAQNASEVTPALASGLAAVYRNLAWVYWTSGRYQDSVRVGRRAAELARAIGDEAQLAVVLFRLHIAGDPDVDSAALEHILVMAERTGQLEIVVTAHNMIARRHQDAGEFALGMPHMEQSLAAAERQQNPRHLAWQLDNFAGFLFDLGDWQRARETYARAEAIMREADRHGATWRSVGMSITPGMLALAEGREEDGRRLLEQAISNVEKVGVTGLLELPTLLLAEVDLLTGRTEQAQFRLTSYLQADHPTPAESSAGPALLLAWAEAALGRYAEAEARLEPLIACDASLCRVDALRVRGLIATMQGRWDMAEEALNEALASARAMPYPYAQAKTLWVYGQLEAARGDQVAARENYQAALAICERLGEGLYRPYIERDLRRLAQKG